MIVVYVSSINYLLRFSSVYGTAILICIVVVELIARAQLTTWFLLFHLSYYNIAHRISILKTLLDTDLISDHHHHLKKVVPYPGNTSEKINHQTLNKIGYLFDHLAKASYYFESIYSIPALINLTASFLSGTICLFLFIRELFQSPSFNTMMFIQLALVYFHIVMALIIIVSADLPSHEVR